MLGTGNTDEQNRILAPLELTGLRGEKQANKKCITKNNTNKLTICDRCRERNLQCNMNEYGVGPILDLGSEKVSLRKRF